MRLPRLADLPARIATGGFILHSGLRKWSADADTAAGLHGMASGAYPFLKALPPEQFVKLLSVAEMGTGAALLIPVVPTRLAGAALTAFSGGLVGMYARTPALREPNSIWPSQDGLPIAKDTWMLGIGLGFLLRAPSRS
ncbi:DoxX family membrane protein [Rhodococcus sp. D2-41]|uniref:DoxX family membrane protein n=1 Tax=Speluncibacter jeojiensis TaxID=2710754 RepID=A0A9X4M0G4_9ACTN|nr:DoxX family membrane protein [Rhodococcus sp. D2-41]MDG3012300.1 DoxX family membrane protein [Rhodococcus sp. D2-41]MDG3014725.1 DoxX family membrane protein [Corynebacteriales bacterium D3-21]